MERENVTAVQMENNSHNNTHQSRTELYSELKKLSINSDFLGSLTIDQLSDLLYGINKVVNYPQTSHQSNRPKNSETVAQTTAMLLSSIDKRMLKALLESGGRVSTLQLSKDLDIPLSTAQRRRRRIEEELINNSTSLRYEKFALRSVTFLMRSSGRSTTEIAQELLAFEELITVTRIFGDGPDLKADAIVKSNEEVSKLSERIKGIQGITHVSWIESLEVLGRKKDADLSIIDSA